MPERTPTPSDDLAAAKAALRNEVSRRRLSPEALAEENRRLTDAVLRLPEWRQARVVGLYLAFDGEAATQPLIAAGRDQGKQLCVPARLPAEDGYAMALLEEHPRLSRGRFDVMEPAEPAWVRPDTIDLVIVPGVAFDPRGNRLGHGKGYYDRLLARLRAVRVAPALSTQWVEGVPHGPRDLPMDIVITADGVWRRNAPAAHEDLPYEQDT